MATVKLTKRLIDSLSYQGAIDEKGRATRCIHWDIETRGLGLRVYPLNSQGIERKAFVLSFRIHGRKRLMTVGDYGPMTFVQARERASKYLVQARDGIDPLEERKKAAAGETFEDLCKKFIEDHAKKHKKTWKTDEGRIERHIPKAWKTRKVQAITHEDIRSLHAKIGTDRPYEANRTLDLLHVMFRLGRPWFPILQDQDNPAEGIRKFKEHSRKRFATPNEIPAIAKSIDAEPNIYVRAALWLYLVTGLRKNELLPRRRDEVEWKSKRLRLPDTKAGEEQHIPLSDTAMAILRAIPEVEKNPHLFPGARKGRPLVNIDKPWRRVRKRAKVEDLTLHDLRRSVGSWMTDAGVDLNRIKQALRHANVSTTLTYARLGEDAAREPMEQHGKRIMEAAGRLRAVEAVSDDSNG